MIDFVENMTINFDELLPVLERSGFRYLLKQREDEHQFFMSDDFSNKINNLKLSVNTRVQGDFKNHTYVSAIETSRFCINGSTKDCVSSKKQILPKSKKNVVQTGDISPKMEVAMRSHR